MAISPDGTRLYVVKNGGRVAVVDTTTGTVVTELKADAQAIEVSSDGHYLWMSRPMSEEGVAIWDLSTNRLVKTFKTGFSFQRPDLVVTPDGFRAYVNSAHNVQVVKLDVIPYPATTLFAGDKRSLTLSPDGTRLYVGDTDSEQEDNPPFRTKTWGMVRVVDTSTNNVVAQINVTHIPSDVAFSPDGSRAYVGFSNSGKIAVIDTSTNKVIGSLDGVDVRSMTVSPDGTRLYVTNFNGLVVVSTAVVTPV